MKVGRPARPLRFAAPIRVSEESEKTLDSLRENFIGTSNDINSKRAFLPHAREFFEIVVGTTNSALTLTRKLGQRVLAIAVEERNLILSGQVFSRRVITPDRIVAGSNITLTRKLGSITITGSAGSSSYFEPVTSGDIASPEIVFHNGDVVMHEVSL